MRMAPISGGDAQAASQWVDWSMKVGGLVAALWAAIRWLLVGRLRQTIATEVQAAVAPLAKELQETREEVAQLRGTLAAVLLRIGGRDA